MPRLATLLAGMVVGWGVVVAPAAITQQGDDVDALNAEVVRLYREGKYSEAIPLAQRALALREKALGPDHADVAVTLSALAVLYYYQGRHADAESLYKRALAIDEKALGPAHPTIATDINNLAELYRGQGRYGESETLYKRALAIRENALGPEHPEVAGSLNNLGVLYYDQGRHTDAEPLYRHALAIREKMLGSDHPDVGQSLNNLAVLYDALGRYADAEPLYKRALALFGKTLAPDHPKLANLVNNLAVLYYNQGRYDEAEPLYKRALTIRERAFGSDHPDVAETINKLAELYSAQGRYADAESLYKRALTIREQALGPDHPFVGMSLNNLAAMYQRQGRYADAEPLYKRALAIREKAEGPNHPAVGTTLNNLAGLYHRQGRYDDAEDLYKRSRVIWEKALGPGHSDVGRSLNNLAGLYQRLGRYDDAEPLYKQSLAIWENALGPDHPDVGHSLNNLAALYFVQGDWARAADFWRRSTGLVIRRVERGTETVGRVMTGHAERTEQSSWQFWDLVKAVHRLAPDGNAVRATLAHEMFETAQWVQGSEAARSLTQMAVRSAKHDPTLADLVRERQDLVGEWLAKDKSLIAAKSGPSDKGKPEVETALADRLAAIDARLAEIDARLAMDFPDYSMLASPKPLSITDVQALLGEEETLVLFLDTPEAKPTPEETFIWALTRTESRWMRSDLGTKALADKVQSLRCGLDEEEWSGLSQAARCGTLLGIDQPAGSDPLPFNLEIAHELYQALFGQVQDLIKGKRLLIVPSGPLTSLPFQVLVTEKPNVALPKSFADYHNVPWLVREHAITVLPSVSSLKALREHAKGSPSAKSYIGYGNPVLDGDGSCKEIEAPDTCPSVEVAGGERQQVAVAEGPVRATVRGRSGRRSPDLAKVFAKGGGAAAVLAQVRALCPLPDTAYEIGCVAERLGVPRSEIRLDAAATEADLKALSESGALANYRVVHFATHGLLAGDVEAMAQRQGEPALVLTPPKEPKDADDNGLLTASEVTELKLNADWIVLSACNTASGDKLGAEALSGLARAFFYAGARTLLVSHWPVYSDAAVRLTTRAFAEMEQDKTVGRAEAFQRAMLALMDDRSQDDNAHPAVWAPFVVVGEGAR